MTILNRIERKTLARALKFAGMCFFLFGIVVLFSAYPNNAANQQTPQVLQPSTPASSDSQPAQFPGSITYITRSIWFDSYGTFYTVDTIAFINNGTSPIQYFYMCLNQTQASQMYEMLAQTVAGERLHVEAQSYTLNGYNVWKITLATPLLPGFQSNFTVWQYFANAVTITANSKGANFVLFHSLYTIVPYAVRETFTTVNVPPLTLFLDHYPVPTTTTSNEYIYLDHDMGAFYSPTFYLHFQNNDTTVVETQSSVVTVELSNTVDWTVSDAVVIENLGIPAVSTLMFIVPKDAHGFTAYDSLAFIQGVSDNNLTWGSFKNITINLSYTRYPIKTNEHFSFTFSFLLPSANRIITGDTQNAISLDIFKLCFNPWFMNDVQVRIALPQAMSIDLLNVPPNAVDNVNDIQYLVYMRTGTTMMSSKIVTVIYTYDILAMQTRPLLIALIAGLATTFLIIARKISMQSKKPLVPVQAEIPLEDLKEFTDIFEDKISTFVEIDTLNNDFNRRKIKKREYQLKIEDLLRQLKLLDQQIKPSKKILINLGGRFKEIITELDVLEAERQSIQDSMIALDKRYKDGQIKSRAAYEQLFENYNMRFKKIQSSIDSGVNELRSYVS